MAYKGEYRDDSLVAIYEQIAETVRKATREVEALRDELRLHNDATVRELGIETFHPECLLSEDDRGEISARQMWRTLRDIDDLPE